MTRFPNPSLDRRQLLRTGGLALSVGALAAACGAGRSGSSDPGRLGVVAPVPTLPEGEIDDVVALRTLQSLEYTAMDVYAAASATGLLTEPEAELVDRFVADHEGHAALIGSLITDAGGDEFTCGNPFLADRVVEPALAAVQDSDDPHRDLVAMAFALESLAAESYQAMVTVLEDPSLRQEAMQVGGEENRHAAALAMYLNPDELVSPVITGGVVETDDAGFPVPYAIPAVFGQLTGIDMVLGKIDDEGSRYSVQLQTPAENSYVYEYQSC